MTNLDNNPEVPGEVKVTPSEQRTKAEALIISRGKRALEEVRNTFAKWLEVAHALSIGRAHAMNIAGINDPELVTGSGIYRQAMNTWLAENPPFDDRQKLPDATRHWLMRCWDHQDAILAWRRKDPIEDTRFNYPETAFKRWARKERPDLLTSRQQDDDERKTEKKPARKNQTAEAVQEAAGTMIEIANNLGDKLDEHAQQLNLPFGPLPDQAAVIAVATAALRAYEHPVLSALAKTILLMIGDTRPAYEFDEPDSPEPKPEPKPEPEPAEVPAKVRGLPANTCRVTVGDKDYTVTFYNNPAGPAVTETLRSSGAWRNVRRNTKAFAAAVAEAELQRDKGAA